MNLSAFNPLTDPMVQILDENGGIVEKDLLPNWTDDELQKLYGLMVMLRMADQKLLNLQKQGRSGTYASIEGQEACQIGSAYVLSKSDWIFPTFRELAACYVRGVSLEKQFLYWMGNEWGSHVEACVAPVSIPIGTQCLHAAGFAWACKLQKKKAVAVAYFGDGATSTGDFYEALNFAGALKMPVIFICQNNQWAISVPRSKQSATKTLAQKAVAGGIQGIQVDGNDIFAAAAVTKYATDRARNESQATLIEMVTYRLGHHTTSDDSARYRQKEEVADWRKKDPIARLKLYLQKKKLWDGNFQKKIEDEAFLKIQKAVATAETTTKTKPEEIFDYTYEKLTPIVKEQKEYLLNFLLSLRA